MALLLKKYLIKWDYGNFQKFIYEEEKQFKILMKFYLGLQYNNFICAKEYKWSKFI